MPSGVGEVDGRYHGVYLLDRQHLGEVAAYARHLQQFRRVAVDVALDTQVMEELLDAADETGLGAHGYS